MLEKVGYIYKTEIIIIRDKGKNAQKQLITHKNC